MNPVEHCVFLIAFHTTKLNTFSMDAVRKALSIAHECAAQAQSLDEFRSLMEDSANRIHNDPEGKCASDHGRSTA
jgi:hypothetical protein